MKKLAKYLKPFVFGLLAALALLFGQALCDLNLPNLMSDIVNVGIQQSGIEDAAPEALSPSGYALMKTFMYGHEQQLLENAYTLVDSGTTNAKGKTYDSIYTQSSGPLYIRTADKADLPALNDAFGTATWTFINTMQALAEQSGQSMGEGLPTDGSDVDMEQLYQLLPMFSQLPSDTIGPAWKQAIAMEESLRLQSGVVLAKGFYTELGRDMSAMQTGYILRAGLFMLIIALLGGIATVMVSLISSKISAGVARNLRRDVFAKIESFSSAEFDRFSTASLITRCTNDIMQIQTLLMFGIRMVCYAPIMAIGGIIMAVGQSVSMSWIIAVACIALLGLIMIIMSLALPKFKIMQKLIDRLNLVARENLSGLMVIRAFGTQNYEKKRFDAANTDLAKTNLFIYRVMTFMFPFMMLIMNGVSVLIIWVGSHQIAGSAMQIGSMMAFMQYAMQIIMSFLMISMMFVFIPRAAVSAERIAEVLGTKNTLLDPPNPKPFPARAAGLVEFQHVHFRYDGAPEDALSDITFTAQPGQITAIIGSTGSGKSTIASLLLRLYDVTQGKVLVDGLDVREVTQKDLRAQIGFVPQKGSLLSGTVASNIKYGAPDASDAVMERAAIIAQAMDFIDGDADRFEREIAQGGDNVSGGQKQRLSIARALAIQPNVLVFDASFSALDYKTETNLRRALKENTGQSTVIVIAQRVSSIMTADQILVLDEGRIVGLGTHKDLLKTCPEYYEIASSQLSKEELA